MIRCDIEPNIYDWLNKFYSFCTAAVVIIGSGKAVTFTLNSFKHKRTSNESGLRE